MERWKICRENKFDGREKTMWRTVAMMMLLAVCGLRTSAEVWPKETAPEAPVLIVHRVKGTAYLRRAGKLYTISGFDCVARAKQKQHPVRLLVLDKDHFWLDNNTTAQVSSIGKDGKIGVCRAMGDEAREKDAEYYKNYDKLTPEQRQQVRLLVCSAANSKPLTDLTRSGLVLPLENGLVQATVIPYRFWGVRGVTAKRVSLTYELAEGQIDLGSRDANGTPSGLVDLNRAALVKKLRKHFRRDEGWQNKPIPVTLRVTDSEGRSYAVGILLADEASSKPAAQALKSLAQTLKESPGDDRDVKVSELVSQAGEFPSELLYLLAQAKANTTHQMLLMTLGEDVGIEPKALLAAQGKR